MSDLGDKIQAEIDAIMALKTQTETPQGSPGDNWATEYENFVQSAQVQLNNAAPDSIRNQDGTIGADVDNDVTNTGELSVNGNGPVTGITGDSGEYVTLYTDTHSEEVTFSNTGWAFWIANNESKRLAPSRLKQTGIANYYFYFAANIGRADSDDTATTTVRLFNTPESEVSVTGVTASNATAVSPIIPASTAGLNMNDDEDDIPLVEYKTDKGQGQVNNITFYIIGEIA